MEEEGRWVKLEAENLLRGCKRKTRWRGSKKMDDAASYIKGRDSGRKDGVGSAGRRIIVIVTPFGEVFDGSCMKVAEATADHAPSRNAVICTKGGGGGYHWRWTGRKIRAWH